MISMSNSLSISVVRFVFIDHIARCWVFMFKWLQFTGLSIFSQNVTISSSLNLHLITVALVDVIQSVDDFICGSTLDYGSISISALL